MGRGHTSATVTNPEADFFNQSVGEVKEKLWASDLICEGFRFHITGGVKKNLEILEGEVGVELLRFELIIVHTFKVTVCGNSFENDAVGLIAFQQIRGHSYVN